MFGNSKGNTADTNNRDSSPAQEAERSTIAHSAVPAALEANSSISSGLSIIGKIVGQGKLGIFGHVEGEVHASTVQIGDGAQVEGDIYHRSLAIEENAQFEGMSRRQENVINTSSLVPAKRPPAQAN